MRGGEEVPRTWPAMASWKEGAQTSGSLSIDPGDLRLPGVTLSQALLARVAQPESQ